MARLLSFLQRALGKPAAQRKWVMYTRRDCPLCDEMRAALDASGLARGEALDLVDVDTDRALQDRFGMLVPVLEVDGQVVCEAHFDCARVAARLAEAGA